MDKIQIYNSVVACQGSSDDKLRNFLDGLHFTKNFNCFYSLVKDINKIVEVDILPSFKFSTQRENPEERMERLYIQSKKDNKKVALKLLKTIDRDKFDIKYNSKRDIIVIILKTL